MQTVYEETKIKRLFCIIFLVSGLASFGFAQFTFSGKLLYGFSLGGDGGSLEQNHRIDDSSLVLRLTPQSFIQLELGAAAPHDALMSDINDEEVLKLITLNRANVSIDLLNSLGMLSVPFSVTLTTGLVDRENIDPAKVSLHELEDVSLMELADWAVCLDVQSGIIGIQAAVATSKLNKQWPHTLVSFSAAIDPFLLEIACEAYDDGDSAVGHVSAGLRYDIYISRELSLVAGVDADIGFVPAYSELLSWGAAAAFDYHGAGPRVKASIGSQGRWGRQDGKEITGEALRAVSAAAEVWLLPQVGAGLASVLSLSNDAPWLPLNAEVAALFQLGPVSISLGYLFVPEQAANRELAGVLVWATRLETAEGRHISGLFFTTSVEF